MEAPLQRALSVFAVIAALSAPWNAMAVDTVETWDVGATDVDFYVGFSGIGCERNEGELSGELMVGYGIIERLSLYLGATLSATELFDQGVGEIYLGTFGTPLDTNHVDIDLFLDFRLGGGFSEFQLRPALELNFDLVPDLGLWGIYIIIGVPIYGQTHIDQAGEEQLRRALSIETTIGTYLTLAERHQILLDVEITFRPMAGEDEREVEIGSIGLGYNVAVHDAIELIAEARIGIPQAGHEVTVGFVAGLIATLPAAGTIGQQESAE